MYLPLCISHTAGHADMMSMPNAELASWQVMCMLPWHKHTYTKRRAVYPYIFVPRQIAPNRQHVLLQGRHKAPMCVLC
jgi:hypothetical protein